MVQKLYDKMDVYFEHEPAIKDIERVKKDLAAIVGDDYVSTDKIHLISYGKDYWLIGTRFTLDGVQPSLPDMVVWPRTVEQVSEIVMYCNKEKIPIIPYGEGSGVVGGALSIKGGLIVDMKYFDKIEIDPVNLIAKIGVGVNGANLERYLDQHGFRMGHIPQSVRTSTVGGYVAHRAAGQFSGKYGKMEDIVKSLEVVLPTGEIIRSKTYPRASIGPMVDRIFLGSEGTLGIVTEVECRIWPKPEKQGLISFLFDDMQSCLDAIRETYQGQIYPAVVRIYDKIETKRHFGHTLKESKDRIMVIFVCEGPSDLVDLEVKKTSENCRKHGGIPAGEEPVRHWFETRFVVKESSEFGPYGLVFDTIEVACMWDKANEVYEKVCEAILNVPGAIMASGHASHFYPEGVCWYFTFGAMPRKDQDPIDIYSQCWDAAVRTVLSLGGVISHHHGIGVNRTRWMELEHKSEMLLLRKLKRALDPNNIMNPGKLYDEDVMLHELDEKWPGYKGDKK